MIALALSLLLAAPAAAVERLPGGPFGAVELGRPEGAPTRVVLLLSGEGGWDARAREVAAALSGDGALVLGLSTSRWSRALRPGRCAYPAGDLESVAQSLEQRLALPSYLRPILVGIGTGATVAFAAEAQAPAGSFLGALAAGARPAEPSGIHFCRGSAGDRPGVPVTREVAAADLDGLRAAVRELQRRAEPPPAPSSGPAVADLPLVEVPASGPPGPAFALLVTGDGGWAGIDRELAAALSAKGLPVVGLDSLKYFWTRRTPEGFAADLGRVIEHYAAAWGRAEVALIGYSRGADVLPAATGLLAPGARARVRALALIGPGREAEFELHLADYLTSGSGGRPILPDAQKLGATPIVCLYGRDESDESLCPLLRPGGARVVELGGGHHFGGDYGAVASEVLAALEAPAPRR